MKYPTRKHLIPVLLVLVLCVSLLSTSVSAASGPAVSSNINDHFYVNADRWTDPINSTLALEGDRFVRVEHINGSLVVEYYDRDFQYLSGKTLELELPIFGGVYMCDDYNFVVVGQDNEEENDETEVFRIIRYSKDWVRQASCGLFGANTIHPFEAGCVRFDRSGDHLYIRTSHEMYTTSDGLNHQANVMINVRISDMTVTDELTDILNRNYGYISHSFNQFVRVDGTNLLAVDHGDAMPRSVVLMKYVNPAGQDNFYGKVSYVNALPIVDSTYHYNDTGVAVGGFEFSSTDYLIAGCSYDQTASIDLMYAHRNIFVTATPKDNFTDEATTVHWLTDYTAADGVTVSPPHLVKLEADRFLLVWTENGTLKSCFLNGKGEMTSQVITGDGDLSDCVPIVAGDQAVWYVTNNSAPVFHTLSTIAPHAHDYTGKTTAPTCTEGGYTVYTCTICGESYTGDETAPLGHDYDDGACTRCGAKLDGPVVTASNVESSGKIRLTWNAVPGAAKYKVYRASSENGSYKLILTTANTNFTNTSVKPGDTYYYYVAAVDAQGDTISGRSNTVRGICKLARTTVTTSNVASSGKIKLTWKAVDGATGYEVYRAASKNGSYSLVSTSTGTSYTDNAATATKRYYYKVVAAASDPAVNSAASSVVSRLCDLARPNLTLSSVYSSGKIKLTWNTISGASGYKIYRSTDGENWKLLKTINDASDNDFTNTSIDAGTKYYYRIRAIASDSNANSAYSTSKSRTCDLPRPVVTASLNSKGKPSLSWDAVPGAVEYKVYRADSRDGTYKLIKTTDKTTFVNTSVASYDTFYYRVVAVHKNTAANSAKSLAVGVSASSTNISTSHLSRDFISRINEYREYYGIAPLDWHDGGEIAVQTRAAEYTINFSENRPDGSSTEEMMEAYGIAFEVGLQSDMEAADIVDVLMYYEEYADFVSIFMYEEWTYAVAAENEGNWCILFG